MVYVYYVSLWVVSWFMRFESHCIRFLITFHTTSPLFLKLGFIFIHSWACLNQSAEVLFLTESGHSELVSAVYSYSCGRSTVIHTPSPLCLKTVCCGRFCTETICDKPEKSGCFSFQLQNPKQEERSSAELRDFCLVWKHKITPNFQKLAI